MQLLLDGDQHFIDFNFKKKKKHFIDFDYIAVLCNFIFVTMHNSSYTHIYPGCYSNKN